MITLNCDGGLCNRMRAIDAAVEFSKNAQQPLQVIWNINDGLNCPYNELFQANKNFTIINKKWYHYTGQPRHHSFLRSLPQIAIEKLFFDKVFYENDKFNKDILECNPQSLTSYKKIYITNSNNFLKTPRNYNLFEPVNTIQTIIDEQKKQFVQHVIGVHIRRTDNSISIANSTDQAFEKEMKMQIAAQPNTIFFIATDDANTEEKFRKLFPNKIISYKKIYGRNNKKGIQDAVVDLYLLASTKKVLASFYSSFSEAAAAIGNIPLQVIK